MRLPDFLLFASDATLFALAAAGLLALSVLAACGERRRKRRRSIDAVGLMPWRDVGVLSLFAGLVLLAMAVMGWLKG